MRGRAGGNVAQREKGVGRGGRRETNAGETPKGEDERARSDDSLGCKGKSREGRSIRIPSQEKTLDGWEVSNVEKAGETCQGVAKVQGVIAFSAIAEVANSVPKKGGILLTRRFGFMTIMLSDAFTCLILLMVYH